MSNYEYVGCVTGFSESGNTQLIAPTEPQYPVERATSPYTERLLGVKLLLPLDSDSGGDGDSFDWSSLAVNDLVVLDGHGDGLTFFEAEINGVVYNQSGADGDLSNALYGLGIMDTSGGYYPENGYILEFANESSEILNVKLTALPQQNGATTKFITGTGKVEGNVFYFRLAAVAV